MKSVFYVVFISILLASCSTVPSGNSINTAIAQTQAAQITSTNTAAPYTDTPEPTATHEPTATRIPTATQLPTATQNPTPTYSQPVVLVESGGTGVTVTDDYQLPKCWKAVFYWNVAPNNYGSASLILQFHNKASAEPMTLVNEFAMDVSADGLSGSILQPLKGGEYYFSSDNTDEAWTIRVECQDNVAPIGNGLNMQAKGLFVSDNYVLFTCNKSIFNWSVESNSSGAASLILYLCDLEQCSTIVNEFKMDLTTPLTGQALQAVHSGIYFISSDNTLENWNVNWECKD